MLAEKEEQLEGGWQKTIKQYDILYRNIDSTVGINEVIIEKQYKLYGLVILGNAVKSLYEAIKQNSELSPYTNNDRTLPDIHFSENKLTVYIRNIHRKQPTAVKTILDGIYILTKLQAPVFSFLVLELNKEFQSLGMLGVEIQPKDNKKIINTQQRFEFKVAEKQEQIGEWKKIIQSRDTILYKNTSTAGISEVIIDKKYKLYSLEFAGDALKLLYQTIQKHKLLSRYTANGSVPDIHFSESKLTIYVSNLYSQNTAIVKPILNSIYRLVKMETPAFSSLILELNKELQLVGMQNIEPKQKDYTTEIGGGLGIADSLKKIGLITSQETKFIDITDPNREPTNDIHSDYYACAYYEKKIITILLMESINNQQFKELQKLIQADFINRLPSDHFMAKDIWLKIALFTTYQDFVVESESIRQKISQRFSEKNSEYVYRNNHGLHIPLLRQDTDSLDYKIRDMLVDFMQTKSYFDIKDLFCIKEENAKDQQELWTPSTRIYYAEQEQDVPQGPNVAADAEQYRACQQCEKDWDKLLCFILKMRFMIEEIHPARAKGREIDLIKLSSTYSQSNLSFRS